MKNAMALGTSPMMLGYAAAKDAAPGHVVLYRVGEFYEVLGQDATTVSHSLGLQLTRRRQKDSDDVPMCGIPAGTSQQAMLRLLAAGHKIAVSEQPAESGGERPLRRLTPATSVDAEVVPAERSNNLTVALAVGGIVAFAWIDLSTGEAGATTASLEGCGPALARIAPVEVLVAGWPEHSEALAVAIRSSGAPFSVMTGQNQQRSELILIRAYGETWQARLRGFSPAELAALAALMDYVATSLGHLPENLSAPRRTLMSDTVQVDAPTLRGLEVLTSGTGREGSLLSVIDRTVTAAGARLLARQLAGPLTSPQQIARRLAMVRFLVANPQIRSDCREDLSTMPDMLRACGRLSLRTARPVDLTAIRDGLEKAAAVAIRLRGAENLPQGLLLAARELSLASESTCADVAQDLRRSLTSPLPPTSKEGGYVTAGYSLRLDKARLDKVRAQEALDSLQARYVAETGVKTLRIRVNTLVGYHIEVPSSQAKALGETFIIRQGLASSTRSTRPNWTVLPADWKRPMIE